MDSVRPSAVTPNKSRLARTIAKVLHLRAATGIAPVDGVQKVKSQEFGIPEVKSQDFGVQKVKSQAFKAEKVKSQDFGVQKVNYQESGVQKVKSQENGIQKVKSQEKVKDNWNGGKVMVDRSEPFDKKNEELQERVALEAHLAKLFAGVSSVKAAYAQLQHSQCPYDAEGIQAADKEVVSELKNLSELKRCFLKRQFDPKPETTLVLAEIEEQKSVLKTYEIMGKKLESQVRLKDSEIVFLEEKLEEAKDHNKLLEKRLNQNQSGQLHVLDNLHLSALSPSHFITVLRHTVKSIRSFVRMMVDDMKSAGWDIHAAAKAIDRDVLYWKEDHKCFAFEHSVCKEMFDAFQYPNFSLPNESLPEKKKQQQQLFFVRFTELKSMKPKDYLSQNPRSAFAKFCRVKYLRLVHPKMETSFFGNLNQRNLINAGEFPSSDFFASFAEMAKRVWLLHCLAFSFDPEAAIFQVSKGCRFSEVYMDSLDDGGFLSTASEPQVGFTVVPGFRLGKTVIQCQVYLTRLQSTPRKQREAVNQ
ncbi:protein GRAVITROPIC IN THE LIGHT 1 isoform X2 [Pyrus x bretschneideri]|nr:protein GRAVITROPIC IN THE LIGHT 1 isoform X2 [Pyrus x bretschneideri]XP_048441665.1 protein GRAVITROPIC IN THE LIGHT 1 isoform X2 [Pyrus x bretschneideri]XP_048441666.1 protein GRAVITROPIC IN THE LIGHT 1 isoform X2 [Pyrus x bretschneideri]XP_048441667.1 protein GRAVITROPIC IN THE LIGHT 1 isoform X2 [Pyrus x bretschneideri]